MDKRQKIINCLLAVSRKNKSPSPDQSLFESGWLDSFTLIDFLRLLEQEFLITIPDSDLSVRKFDSVTRIESYLTSRGK
jgi:acyl carrier protein